MTAAGSIDSVLKDPVPEVGYPLSGDVHLQRGLYNQLTGEWQTEGVVRELTGADEEFLSSLESKSNVTYSEYMTSLLKRAVVNIGSFVVEDDPEIIDGLTIGDRDILFLGIIKATYGLEREFRTTCMECGGKNDVMVNLEEDFPIQEPSVDLHEPLVVTLRNGKVIKIRLPTGADSNFISKKSGNSAVQNTLMLSRCVVLDPSELKGKSTEDWAKSLNMADRGKLIKALLDVKSGPKMEEVNVQCAHCEVEMPISLNWMSLLFG
jgi:hypothetical protein